MTRPFVVIESPYAGKDESELKKNIDYARAAVKDSLERGEAPFASHLLYTQDGILDDNIADERKAGINAGLDLHKKADVVAVYADRGISNGVARAIEYAALVGAKVEIRSIRGKTFRGSKI